MAGWGDSGSATAEASGETFSHLMDHVAQGFEVLGRSTVTFEIEPLGDLVKLTVVHDGFAPGSVVLPDITGGWPRVLSGLKSLLETGETVPAG
jgi:hypothetical protein